MSLNEIHHVVIGTLDKRLLSVHINASSEYVKWFQENNIAGKHACMLHVMIIKVYYPSLAHILIMYDNVYVCAYMYLYFDFRGEPSHT
jgi:hypothetical protein